MERSVMRERQSRIARSLSSAGAMPTRSSGLRLAACDEQRLDVFSAGDLRMRWLKAALQFSLEYQRTRLGECISQRVRPPQRLVEEGVAEIGPLGLVLAAERWMVGIRCGYDQRVCIRKPRDEYAGIAGRDDHHLALHAGAIEHAGQIGGGKDAGASAGHHQTLARAVRGENDEEHVTL